LSLRVALDVKVLVFVLHGKTGKTGKAEKTKSDGQKILQMGLESF
jgi:hypothetical protein